MERTFVLTKDKNNSISIPNCHQRIHLIHNEFKEVDTNSLTSRFLNKIQTDETIKKYVNTETLNYVIHGVHLSEGEKNQLKVGKNLIGKVTF